MSKAERNKNRAENEFLLDPVAELRIGISARLGLPKFAPSRALREWNFARAV